jgi:hypothetical protein
MHILQYILAKGLQRLRDVGFFPGNVKKLRLKIQLLSMTTCRWKTPVNKVAKKAVRLAKN